MDDRGDDEPYSEFDKKVTIGILVPRLKKLLNKVAHLEDSCNTLNGQVKSLQAEKISMKATIQGLMAQLKFLKSPQTVTKTNANAAHVENHLSHVLIF